MKRFLALMLAALAACAVPACRSPEESAVPAATFVAPGVSVSVEALPPLVVAGTNPPQGVAGAFSAATPDGKIVVAGGCNFPEKGPADGGAKVFYADVLTLPRGAAAWTRSRAQLPVPAAYGVGDASAWIGGGNASGKLSRVFAFDASRERVVELGNFPVKLDNAASSGAFVAGGNVNGAPANKAFFARTPLPDFPGTPRVQPVAGTLHTPRGTAFALVGGFFFDKEKNSAVLDRAGVVYFPAENEWKPLPPLPEELSEAGLVGSAAVGDGQGGMLIFGGVNAKIFKDALEAPAPDYLRRDPAWYKFNADVLRLSFDAGGNAKWEKLATVPATARAGASVVRISETEYALVCGELKPGVRSTDCTLLRIIPAK